MFVVQNRNNKKYVYQADGWQWTADINQASQFDTYEQADRVRRQILNTGEFLLDVVKVP
jgi:hypothetical protein